jgi:hypothetical protein
LLVAAAIVAVANMVELLHLIGREDRGELLSGLLVNGSHLLLHNYRGDGVVVFQFGDLLLRSVMMGSSVAFVQRIN